MEINENSGNNKSTTNNVTKAFIKDYETLDNLLHSWYNELCKKSSLCVAISRKAPRLIEWCHNKWGNNTGGPDVVSEIAIPFLHLEQDDNCIVVDEAIYHGTTFSKICEMVQSPYPNLKVDALPLVVTEKALIAYPTLKEKLRQPYCVINEDDINFFIDTIVMRFQDGCKPYDMEFPIMYIQVDNHFGDDIVQQITDSLKKEEQQSMSQPLSQNVYAVDNYSRESGEFRRTYSYVFEYRFDELLDKMQKPDFCKLRFRYDANKKLLTIAIMAPYVINDLDIIKESPLFSGQLLTLWNKIYDAAFTVSTNNDEYLYQRQKSLVVVANYLLSYNAYQLLLPSLEKVLSKYSTDIPHLQLVDLTYLLGSSLAQTVQDELKAINGYYQPKPTLLAAERQTSYIPILYTDAYNSSIGFDNLNAGENLSAKISNLFSAMRWEVDMQSRNEAHPRYYNRLRYGESYDSLVSRFANVNMSPVATRQYIHQYLDSRIDRGSVVPNYIKLDNLSQYWTRLFRSGENEDLLKDQFLRVVLRVFSEYETQTQNRSMPRAVFNLLFALLLDNDSYSPLFCFKTEKALSACSEETFMDFDGLKASLFAHAAAYDVLANETGDYLRLNSYPRTLRYLNEVPLSHNLIGRITKAVSVIHKLNEKHGYISSDYENLTMIMHYDLPVFREKVESFSKERVEDIEALSITELIQRMKILFDLIAQIPQHVKPEILALADEWECVLTDNNRKIEEDKEELNRLTIALMRMLYIYNVYILSRGGKTYPLFQNPSLRERFQSIFTDSENKLIDDFQISNAGSSAYTVLTLINNN